ncbi:hypothetical protein H257_17797, partial [Aphanomyces astaci]
MVRRSERQLTLQHAMMLLDTRQLMRMERTVLSENDSDEDDLDSQLICWIRSIENRRYLSRRINDPFKAPRFHHFLFETRRTRFRKLFRVERSSFDHIVVLIQADPSFMQMSSSSTQRPVSHQLLVFLYFLGANGNAVSNEHMSSLFGIGAGTIALYIRRVMDAIVRLRDQFILWPNHSEASSISLDIYAMCGFTGCIGFIDGTLFPFEFKPTLCGEDYYSRKGCYAVAAQIICDHRGIIRDVHADWPGSTHDNRVWRNSKIWVGEVRGPGFNP